MNPNDTQGLLPNMGMGDHQMQNMAASSLTGTTGLQSNSLDFLADISAHHARTEADVNAMMIDNHQPYLGWNEMPTADHTSHRGSVLDPMPNDMLQLWLEPRGDTGSLNGSLDISRDPNLNLIGENMAVHPDQQHRPSVDSSKSGNIPYERFARVQSCWIAPFNPVGRLINSLWRDVANSEVDNLFAVPSSPFNGQSEMLQGSRYGLDEGCRQRLQAIYSQSPLANPQMLSPGNDASSSRTSASVNGLPTFPPTEILDMALDLYFRHFHPLVPFVHLPTFSARETRPSLLYAMCLIGMVMLGTKGTLNFVSKNFTVSRITVCISSIDDCSSWYLRR